MVTPDVMIGTSFLFSLQPLGHSIRFLQCSLGLTLPSTSLLRVLMVLPRLYEMNDTMVTAAQDLATKFDPSLAKHCLRDYGSVSSWLFYLFSDDFAVTFFLAGMVSQPYQKWKSTGVHAELL